MKTLLLIDASALIHRFFYALPPLTTPKGEPINAIYGLSNVLMKIFRQQKPDHIAAAFDRPEPTFRDEIFKEYKIQRPKPADELIDQIVRMREVFEIFNVQIFEKVGFEADDVIGTLADKFRKEDVKIIILSGDNDLLQLVDDKNNIEVHITRSGISDAKKYNEAAVKEKYDLEPGQLMDYKGLVGDASDNIPGLAGVGPKTATPLLKEFKDVEGVFDNLSIVPEKTSKKFAGHKDNALLYKKLATIRHDVPLEPGALENLKAKSLETEKLKKYFTELGFNSLVNRLEDGSRGN